MGYRKRWQFGNAIREARERVHEDVETRLMSTKNEKGAIFNLKNNFGWRDDKSVDHTIHMPKPILESKTKSAISANNGYEEATIVEEEN